VKSRPHRKNLPKQLEIQHKYKLDTIRKYHINTTCTTKAPNYKTITTQLQNHSKIYTNPQICSCCVLVCCIGVVVLLYIDIFVNVVAVWGSKA
jgi:hypothetical protein